MIEGQKTHTLVKKPSLNVRYLADYMAASEQRKRTVLRGCKYRSTARMIQHIEAKAVVTNHILNGGVEPEKLLEKAHSIQGKLAVDQFEDDLNKHNAEYIKRFYQVRDNALLPSCQIQQAGKFVDYDLNGLTLRFDPALTLTRTTKTNKLKRGALMLRYLKGKPLPEENAAYQSSAMLGLLKLIHSDDGTEPEGAMCFTLDVYTGKLHPAPGNAVYLFNEMKAACQSIAERWDAIGPPPKAVV